MNDLRLIQNAQSIQQLRRKHPHERSREASERVLFDEFVKVVGEEFEDEAEVGLVDEGVFESEHVVFVVLVPLIVDLQRGEGGGGEVENEGEGSERTR
jgi:hypothetical protein